MITNTYDIFISYRRDGADQADRIYTRLQSLGYRVFMDVEALRSGKFNEQLLSVIAQCKDFLLILPPNALDRCSLPDGTPNEEDWVRREVMCAMEHKKNIIPIMLTGFEWPEPMPKEMEDLCMYQALTPLPNTYYDMQIKKLQGYLKSKAHVRIRRRWLIVLGIIAAVFLLLFAISWMTYLPVATQVAENASAQIQATEELATVKADLQKDWNNHLAAIANVVSPERKQELANDFYETLRHTRERIDVITNQYDEFSLDDISDFHVLIFWMHGITPTDLVLFSQMRGEITETLQNQCVLCDSVITFGTYSKWHRQTIEVSDNTFRILAESYYYAYLQLLSHLPKKAQDSFFRMSPYWYHLPNNVGLNLSDSEYDRLQKNTEIELMNQLDAMKMITQHEESELEELQNILDEMEKNVQKLEEMKKDMDEMEKRRNEQTQQ